MTRQNKAYLFAAMAVLCWSTVASAFKLTLRHVDYLTLLLYSSFVSTLFLFIVLLAQGKLPLLRDALVPRTSGRNQQRAGQHKDTAKQKRQGDGADADRPHCAAVHRAPKTNHTNGRRALLRSAANGFLNPFLYYVILFKAYSLLPAQEAQPLNYTWPLMLVLLSAPMLGEKIRPLSILALAVSFFGVLIVSTQGDLLGLHFTNLAGALLAMGSAVVWALFWLTNVKDERDEVLKLFLNFLFGFVYVFTATLMLSRIGMPGEGAQVGCSAYELSTISKGGPFPPPVGLPAALGCIYVGIFEMGAAFILWLKALRLSEGTARVSNLIFLSPFVSLVFIRIVVGETILPSSILGLGFIAGGILIQRTVKPTASH